MFVQVDGEVRHAFSSGERDRISLCGLEGDDPTVIREDASGGAEMSAINYYILDPVKKELVPQVSFIYDGMTDKENPWRIRYGADEESELITEEEWSKRSENYGMTYIPKLVPLAAEEEPSSAEDTDATEDAAVVEKADVAVDAAVGENNYAAVDAIPMEDANPIEDVPAEMLDDLDKLLKDNPRKLIFTEGTDARILDAVSQLKQDGLITPVLIGNVDEVTAAAAKEGFDIEGLEIIDPTAYPDMDKLVDDFVELRKGKATAEQAREMLRKPNYFGTMLVKEGLADGLLGGATYSTADTVRPALQLIKTKEGSSLVSSCMILIRDDEMLAMGDCAINVSYEDKLDDEGNVILSAAQQLAEVAVDTAHTASLFGIEPKIAMLSYSTNGSASGPGPAMVKEATEIVKRTHPELDCDGEMQFDAAYVPEVGQLKFPGSSVAGYANTFIFPEIQSGNIGYKIAQRLGGFMAVGPILQGLNAPINDLSRGCTAEEIYLMSIITAIQSIA